MPFGRFSVAMVTPFTPAGELDESGVAGVVDYLVERGVPALLVSGSTGEQHSMTVEERVSLYRLTAGHLGGRTRWFAGVAAVQTKDAVRLAEAAVQAGADGIMLGMPPYVRASQEEAAGYIRQVADVCGLPILLYNNPLRTAVDLSVETVARVSRDCPQIAAVKEAGDPAKAQAIKQATDGRLAVYSGSDLSIVDAFRQGYDGLTSVAGNLFPQPVQRIVELLAAGEEAAAAEALEAIRPLLSALIAPTPPVGIKYGMSQLGVAAGIARPPLGALSEAQAEDIRREIARFGGQR